MKNIQQFKRLIAGITVIMLVVLMGILPGCNNANTKTHVPVTDTATVAPPQNNTDNAATSATGFTMTGVWYRNDPTVNSKYIFDAPQDVNGKLQGQVDMLLDDLSEGKVNYEVISDTKLRITDPQNSFPAWEMGYVYNAANQTLEIIAGEHTTTYTRNPVYVAGNNNNNAPVAAATEDPLKAIANKLAAGTWKHYNKDEMITETFSFSAPRVENGSIVGDMTFVAPKSATYCATKVNYRYTILSAGQFKWKITSETCDGTIAETVGTTGTESFSFSNSNNTLTLTGKITSGGMGNAKSKICTLN